MEQITEYLLGWEEMAEARKDKKDDSSEPFDIAMFNMEVEKMHELEPLP